MMTLRMKWRDEDGERTVNSKHMDEGMIGWERACKLIIG